MPELSVAVGSIHVITADVDPIGMLYAEDSGHPWITEGVESKATTEENKSYRRVQC